MKKIKINLNLYSKTSLIIRIVISIILIALIGVVIGLREEISRKVYNWGEAIESPDFVVHYIDVGQGDATLIEFDDGKNMLIDCGPTSAADELVDYLNQQQVETIDYFLITHPDADHVGGGVHIFQQFQVKNFYRPMYASASEANLQDYPVHETLIYDNVINAAYAEIGSQMFYSSTALSPIEGEKYQVNFLYPDQAYSSTNASSAILQIELDGFKFLFMGDAEIAQENKIIDEYGYSLRADVLKVGHHGASTSTSEELLAYVSPYYAIISVGENSYGHPSQEVISNLTKYNVNYFTTMDEGSITISIKNGALVVGKNQGKMIDYALITVILAMILFITWGVPDFKRKKRASKDIKK